MPKLTKRLVDSTAAGPAQTLVWDGEVKGFGLRVTPAGAKSYILNYRTADGRTRRYTIGKHGSPWTCEEARTKALAVLRELAAGTDPLAIKEAARVVITVAELVELYLAEGPATKPNKKASSWATDASNLRRHVVPLMGRKAVKSVTAVDVSRLQADIAAGKSAADIKTGFMGRAIVRGGKGIATRVLAIFGAMCEFATKRAILPFNPAKGVELAKGEKKERFLVDREVVALADALAVMEDSRTLAPAMANAIRLLLLTGCRRNEIRSLRWDWVDFDRGCLRLPDSKTGAKIVPLAAAVLELLASMERTSQYVLPSTKTEGHIVGLQKAWDRVRERATELAQVRAQAAGEPLDRAPNLTGVRLHDLRHSYASFAVADGATLFMVGKVLGHRQSRTTEIYAHLHDDPLKAVADRTGKRIADALRLGATRERMPGRSIKPAALGAKT
ncbi:site-specific integrase [Lichenihabitans psoromatis]|uniref:site-specific integrase n=1 Tax=Lichenihabitans psoromatis TaxID=2528642 RepID=UPI001038538C|nr:site-specific integrase [Lichenihabitans psoromatis]